jgi:hypothetical protein
VAKTRDFKPGGAPARPLSVAELLMGSEALRARMGHIGLVDWERAVGERLARKARPERLDEGTLTVRVPSSTWAQELSLFSDVVLERLRARGHQIDRLRFRVASATGEVEPPVTTVRRAELPKDLSSALSRLNDPELRDAIAEAAALDLARGGPERR